MASTGDKEPLLSSRASEHKSYTDVESQARPSKFAQRSSALSFHEENTVKSSVRSDTTFSTPQTRRAPATANRTNGNRNSQGSRRFLYYVIYALVNVIISAPGLYGYAAVIFNHPVFDKHMNALSKLVIFSSLIHQLGFFLFSSLDFAIGTVQDAGLIFLSNMANKIANRMQEEGHTKDEIVSTTLVLLSSGTALLGLVLVAVGRFGLADAVSYLPMPVVGGYLAFIGYFCCQAGVALCISKPLVSFTDWVYLANPHLLLLAAPGMAAGLILTLTSRKVSNDAALPVVMVAIPAFFYLILYCCGISMDEAREGGWVGDVAPPVPVMDLLGLIKFSQVRWDLASDILPTWVGMVFVVSFASCLDVAAISIDMGQALDTNRELSTVGICNFMSGLTMGFTGSYIFSQTIFTYRTGVHSRVIGVLIMVVFFYIVVSPVNMLQIAPLFFLGSTLIFIGYDLLFEWLWEIRHQVFISEYATVWLTFVAIQVVGIDAGIVIGVLVAIVEQVVLTANTSSVNLVKKRSRAVWTPDQSKILHSQAYNSVAPKIVTLEISGTVFFGSALQLLSRITEETGIRAEDDSPDMFSPATPHTPSLMAMNRRPSLLPNSSKASPPRPPKYLLLDLLNVSHLDASATRGCFLQLVKLCAKRGITVCASSGTPRIEWMFRTHEVSFRTVEEETALKAQLQSRQASSQERPVCDRVLMFVNSQEALEFCENALLHEYTQNRHTPLLSSMPAWRQQSLVDVLANILSASAEEKLILARLEEAERYHEERELNAGDVLFHRDAHADSFFILLAGGVANSSGSVRVLGRQNQTIISGAGLVKTSGSNSDLMELLNKDRSSRQPREEVVSMLWSAPAVIGYLDYLLDRPRLFRAIATKLGTRVAQFTQSHMNLLQSEDAELHGLIQRVLLNSSVADLANCTCNFE